MKIPKLQTAWQPIVVSDNTRVTRPVIDYTVERKLQPGEFFYTTKSGNTVVGRSQNATVQQDNRTEHQKQQANKAKVKAQEAEKQKKLDEGAEQLLESTKLMFPSTYVSPLFRDNEKSYFDNLLSGEGSGSTIGNLAIDALLPTGLTKSFSMLKSSPSRFFARNNEDVTSNFLKFVGGSGNPTVPAVPRTQVQTEMYAMLKSSGVDMSKISLEDINKALSLRKQQLLQSGKRFSYHSPVTERSGIIHDIDKGQEIGRIEFTKPFQFNDGQFDPEIWEIYSSTPRNKGLRVSMVENLSQKDPTQYSKQYKGLQERLTNSLIDVAKQQGYEGVVSGEVLLSPEKTINMYPKYTHKKVIGQNGRYHWQNHNPGMPEQPGPIYMLEEPTYKVKIKSQIFDPKIIDSNGKMRINWGKRSTMFNSIIPTVIGGPTMFNLSNYDRN